jgi:xylan 1,4-beta-xylosidase
VLPEHQADGNARAASPSAHGLAHVASKPRGLGGTGCCRLAHLVATAACGLASATIAPTARAADYVISVDASKPTGANPRFWAASVGTGTAVLTLRADLQTHYKLAHRELGMERVRGHGLLGDDRHSMEIVRWSGSGAPSYDWTNFDKYLAAIVAAGMRPIMELDFMPKDLAKNGDSRDAPKDMNVYRQFIQAVVQHCVDRYGADDVGTWYWEVWNEPDYPYFWNGTDKNGSTSAKMTDYYALYDAAVEGATAVLPNILIGGPSTTEPSKIAAFLQHCTSANQRVTFVSSHAYPGAGGNPSADPAALVADNDARLGQIASGGYASPAVMSFNTEWNSAYTGQGGKPGDANESMDSHVNAPFILKAVKLLADQNQGDTPAIDVFSYWAVSDVFGESGGDTGVYIEQQGSNLPFGAVFGLLTYRGIRKAAFNGFKLLAHLGPTRLPAAGGTAGDGVDAMATLSASGDELQIIVYNYFNTIKTTGADGVTVNVSNLPPALANREIYVTQFLVDETHSNPYGVWVGQNKPKSPSEAQWQEMRKAQHLALAQPVGKLAVDTAWSTSFALSRQGATLILLGTKRPLCGRNALVEIEGEDYDGQSGASREDSNDASLGQAISLASGGYVYFDNVDYTDDGVGSVELRVKTGNDTGLQLRADCPTGPLLAECLVTATSNVWATQTCALPQALAGVARLYVVFGGAMHLNWLRFVPAGGVDGGLAAYDSGVDSGNCSNAGSAPSTGAGGSSAGCGCSLGRARESSGSLLVLALVGAVLGLGRRFRLAARSFAAHASRHRLPGTARRPAAQAKGPRLSAWDRPFGPAGTPKSPAVLPPAARGASNTSMKPRVPPVIAPLTVERRTVLQWLGRATVLTLGGDALAACLGKSIADSPPVRRAADGGSEAGAGATSFAFQPGDGSLSIFDDWYENTVDTQNLADLLASWRLTVDGLARNPLGLSFADLLALERQDQVTDFHCVEGWSVLDVPWNGVPLSRVLDLAGAEPAATYVTFHSAGGVYRESLPIAVAREPHTMLGYGVGGLTLPLQHGFPLRLVVPRLLGYKNAKYLSRIELTDQPVTGYWESYGYSYDGEVPADRLRPGKY